MFTSELRFAKKTRLFFLFHFILSGIQGGKEEILSVLTDEQLALMKKRRAQMKGKGRKGDRTAPSGDVQKSEITDS
jgi:hypothetical protein